MQKNLLQFIPPKGTLARAAGHHEYIRRNIVPLQYRFRDIQIVGVTIIEGYCNASPFVLYSGERACDLQARKNLHLLRELGRTNADSPWIRGRRIDPVIHEDHASRAIGNQTTEPAKGAGDHPGSFVARTATITGYSGSCGSNSAVVISSTAIP